MTTFEAASEIDLPVAGLSPRQLFWLRFKKDKAAIAGGILAVYYLILDGSMIRTVRNTAVLLRHHMSSGAIPHPQINVQQANLTRVPFGLAIALGTVFCAGSAFLRR